MDYGLSLSDDEGYGSESEEAEAVTSHRLEDLLMHIDSNRLEDLKAQFEDGNMTPSRFVRILMSSYLPAHLYATPESKNALIASLLDLFQELDTHSDGVLAWSEFTSLLLEQGLARFRLADESEVSTYALDSQAIKGLETNISDCVMHVSGSISIMSGSAGGGRRQYAMAGNSILELGTSPLKVVYRHKTLIDRLLSLSPLPLLLVYTKDHSLILLSTDACRPVYQAQLLIGLRALSWDPDQSLVYIGNASCVGEVLRMRVTHRTGSEGVFVTAAEYEAQANDHLGWEATPTRTAAALYEAMPQKAPDLTVPQPVRDRQRQREAEVKSRAPAALRHDAMAAVMNTAIAGSKEGRTLTDREKEALFKGDQATLRLVSLPSGRRQGDSDKYSPFLEHNLRDKAEQEVKAGAGKGSDSSVYSCYHADVLKRKSTRQGGALEAYINDAKERVDLGTPRHRHHPPHGMFNTNKGGQRTPACHSNGHRTREASTVSLSGRGGVAAMRRRERQRDSKIAGSAERSNMLREVEDGLVLRPIPIKGKVTADITLFDRHFVVYTDVRDIVCCRLKLSDILGIANRPEVVALCVVCDIEGNAVLLDPLNMHEIARHRLLGRGGIVTALSVGSSLVFVMKHGRPYTINVKDLVAPPTLLPPPGHARDVLAAQRLSDTSFVSVALDGEMRVWEVTGRRSACTAAFNLPGQLVGHTPCLRGARPFDHRLSFVSATSLLSVYRSSTEGEFRQPVSDCLWAQQMGQLIVLTGHRLHFFDAYTGEHLRLLEVGHPQGAEEEADPTPMVITAAQLDIRNRSVYLGDSLGGVRVVSLTTGIVQSSLGSHQAAVADLLTYGKTVLSAGKGGLLRVHGEVSAGDLSLRFVKPDVNVVLRMDLPLQESDRRTLVQRVKALTPASVADTYLPGLGVFGLSQFKQHMEQLTQTTPPVAAEITCLAYGDSQRLVAFGSSEGLIRCYDSMYFDNHHCASMHPIGMCTAAPEVTAVAFLGDLPLLVSADSLGYIYLWTTRPACVQMQLVCAWKHESRPVVHYPLNIDPLQRYTALLQSGLWLMSKRDDADGATRRRALEKEVDAAREGGAPATPAGSGVNTSVSHANTNGDTARRKGRHSPAAERGREREHVKGAQRFRSVVYAIVASAAASSMRRSLVRGGASAAVSVLSYDPQAEVLSVGDDLGYVVQYSMSHLLRRINALPVQIDASTPGAKHVVADLKLDIAPPELRTWQPAAGTCEGVRVVRSFRAAEGCISGITPVAQPPSLVVSSCDVGAPSVCVFSVEGAYLGRLSEAPKTQGEAEGEGEGLFGPLPDVFDMPDAWAARERDLAHTGEGQADGAPSPDDGAFLTNVDIETKVPTGSNRWRGPDYPYHNNPPPPVRVALPRPASAEGMTWRLRPSSKIRRRVLERGRRAALSLLRERDLATPTPDDLEGDEADLLYRYAGIVSVPDEVRKRERSASRLDISNIGTSSEGTSHMRRRHTVSAPETVVPRLGLPPRPTPPSVSGTTSDTEGAPRASGSWTTRAQAGRALARRGGDVDSSYLCVAGLTAREASLTVLDRLHQQATHRAGQAKATGRDSVNSEFT
ncbi:hypothetical protein KIPB_005332 [Kipferlia bialata]|uniref:EF-hand domain-containing protein n=1 Tax=Kipferlia bialata TaxID=797122 RepID=A0A9K3CVF3_9EUKA|nr:hypothetical protein KIPB_005332 [Kipferlia bialata]|eukprot:g5332.t1